MCSAHVDNAHLAETGDAAAWYQIPDVPLLSIEHPCVVKNVERAIKMLGGSPAITRSLQPGNDKPISLTFHPEDDASRPILSNNVGTRNVLLRITVPKRTGRKRKR